MKYVFENKVEFYITNVCNLTCENCNRFNNHKFTGWQRWSDYADTYRRWAEVVELKHIVIMGGEPLLNPTILEWTRGLAETFGSSIQILTNGIRLNKVEGLYDTVANLKNYGSSTDGCIGISLHNINHFEQIKQDIKDFLDPEITEEYGRGVGKDRGDNIYYSLRDKNNVVVNMHLSNDFATSSVIHRPDGTYTLHNSDPESAHRQCGFARYKCYHFIRGKLYKCGPVALMPEFDQQFHLDISNEQRQIMNSYQPMTPELWPSSGLKFMAELDNPIPQCSLCPDKFYNKIIFPIVKGSQ